MNTNTPTYALCPSGDIYRRCPGLAWTIYDEQFSLYKSQDPTSRWDIVDAELWLLYISNRQGPSQTSTMKTFPQYSTLKCYADNCNGRCINTPFVH